MKKVMTIVAVSMFILASSVAYAGQFGPLEPAAKEGRVALGIGYFRSSAEWKPDVGESRKLTQNKVYLQLSYSPVKNLELYARVGGADAKMKNVFTTNEELRAQLLAEGVTAPVVTGLKPDFKEGLRTFGTIGVKGFFNVSDFFGIGPFAQVSMYSSFKDRNSGTVTGTIPGVGPLLATGTEEAKIRNLRDINIGIGLQGKIGDVIVYGGPFAYWARAKTDWTEVVTGTIGGVPFTDSFSRSITIEEENNIGGFAGLRLPLGKNLSFEVEGQLKSRFSMGGALTYAF